jgi:putative tryptophan/tyrosine transport system substrate-binding protein
VDRRRFLLTSLAGVLAAPLAAEAQAPPRAERAYRLGWLAQGGPASGNPLWEHFVRRLSELGYAEGRNLIIESRWAARSEQFPDLAAQLVGLRTDVVVTIGMPATQAVARASQSVPIVMVTGGSAIEFGLIHSLARPGGNVTGVTLEVNPDLIGKRVELLNTAVSGVGHIVYA